MDVAQLLEDPWFEPLHRRAADAGFPGHTQTPAGVVGWFFDPDHLINHFHTHGVKLRWAYDGRAGEAKPLLDISEDLLTHCNNVLTPDHFFVGSFCTGPATFLMMASHPSPADDRSLLSLAFCMPGDALNTSFPDLDIFCHKAPWIAEEGMVDCMTMEDPNEGRALLAIGTSGRGRDIECIFKPDEAHFALARTWNHKHGLHANTPPGRARPGKPGNRL
jgi:hypothetical protein